MMNLRFLMALASTIVLGIYACGLMCMVIGGALFHRARIGDVAQRGRLSPIAVLLTCALLWPFILVRVVRENGHG